MITNIQELKTQLKNRNIELFDKINNSQKSEEIFKENFSLLNRYLNQNFENEYLIEVDLIEDNLNEFMLPNSQKAKNKAKMSKIKKQYILKYPNEKYYLLKKESLYKLDNREEQIYKIIRKLLKNQEDLHGIWIYGDFGVGKTYISIVLLNEMALKGYTVGYILLPLFITKVISDIEKNNVFNQIEEIKKIDFLLFDDMGSEKQSQWFRDNFLFPILNYRMEENKFTIFTSNLSINEYKKAIQLNNSKSETLAAERITERINLIVEEINLTGNNLRKRKN